MDIKVGTKVRIPILPEDYYRFESSYYSGYEGIVTDVDNHPSDPSKTMFEVDNFGYFTADELNIVEEN